MAARNVAPEALPDAEMQSFPSFTVQCPDDHSILRRRPDRACSDDAWVEGKPVVLQGEVVSVIRMNAAGEPGFSWIRSASGSEGFLRSEFLRLGHQVPVDHVVLPSAPAVRRPEVRWKAGALLVVLQG